MADVLTAEERQLIDDAVARGQVRRVARGASAWAVRWSPEQNALRLVDPTANNWPASRPAAKAVDL